MDKENFKKIVEQHICPILTGSKTGKTLIHSSNYDNVTIQRGAQIMHLRPTKKADFKIEITRPQIFSVNDKGIVKSIINEIVSHYDKISDEKYREHLMYYAVEIAICKYISPSNYQILFELLNSFDKWATRTYEGKKVTFSIIIDFSSTQEVDENHPAINKILDEDFSALLSNSAESCLEVSAKGGLIKYLNLPTTTAEIPHSPQRFNSFANHSTQTKICLTLTNNGEVLIFQNKELTFSKRRGIWNYFNHKPVLSRIAGGSKKTDPKARIAIYETILDVSFSRTGGCIAFIRNTDIKKLTAENAPVIKAEDIISLGKSIKSQALRILINGKKFQELDRILRKEILGIDGATVIDSDGNIVAAGAIIQISAGSTGGGRLAATKTLAKYGTAIKISADGMVKGFKIKDKKKPEEIFSFG